MNKEIEIGKVYKHNSSFNGEKFSSKVIVIKKDEATSTKKNPQFIVYGLTTPKICKEYPQILKKHNYFWTSSNQLEEMQ